LFSFYFCFNWPNIWQHLTSLALVLDLCGARASERRKDQTPKSVIASSAQRNWLKGATE
jgi:hypothetical protein